MRPRLLRSALFRIALGYTTLFTVSVALIFGFIYWSAIGFLRTETDLVIETEVQAFAERYRRDGLAGLTLLIAERLQSNRVSSSIYLLADRRFQPLVGNLNSWPAAAAGPGDWVEFRLLDAGLPGNLHGARARHFALEGGFHLLVGRNVHQLEAMEATIVRTIIWSSLIMLVLALAGGMLLSRGLAGRIESINRTSREIMAGALSKRIPVAGSGDDFDQLIENLNAMLARIELLMEDISRLSETVAHDLRTPVARLRTRLEALGERLGDDAENRDLVDGAIEEADRLLATFNALLRIAQIESGKRRSEFRDVPLGELLCDVVEFYEALAEEKAQRIELHRRVEASIRGDRDLLFQAFANVLDNAVKYTPTGGRIGVELSRDDALVAVTIHDTGPGIPEAARETIFEPFFRLDASRTLPGSGLGLSLVAAVVRLHDARLRVESSNPGLRMSFTFPAMSGGGSSRALGKPDRRPTNGG